MMGNAKRNGATLRRRGCNEAARWCRSTLNVICFFLLLWPVLIGAFQSPRQCCRSSSASFGLLHRIPPPRRSVVSDGLLRRDEEYLNGKINRVSTSSKTTATTTTLFSFMGSDGGLLGVGTPEVITILLVGYFVLGPSELYKIVKEIGRFIQNIRTVGTDLSAQFETGMESQLQLEEFRKAQAELTDAFSFRRSINVDPYGDAFTTNASTNNSGTTAVAATAATATAATATTEADSEMKPRKKIRRRVKRTVRSEAQEEEKEAGEGMIPDLEMPATATGTTTSITTDPLSTTSSTSVSSSSKYTAEELATINREFEQYTMDDGESSWYQETADGSEHSTSKSLGSLQEERLAQSRFQEQLSGNWNDQIIQNEDKLSPLATVMNKIALLEQEKKSATARLEEEFRKRAELDDKYYQEQRQLLEEAARQVQDEAIGLVSSTSSSPPGVANNNNNTTTTTNSKNSVDKKNETAVSV